MTGIIDTSSLVAIARYYLSIKDEARLLHFLESKFRSSELVFLSTIHLETSRTQKGIALSSMEFLNDKELQISDADILPPAPKKFSNQLDNNLCIPLLKRKLSAEAYALQKEKFMQTGDAKLVFYALNYPERNPVVITEETMYSNDNKLFKKLPTICKFLGIRHMTIAEWLVSNGVSLTWTHPE